jgi:hypothetical protein
MKLTVAPLDQGKYETVVTRDDGVSYRLKGVAHRFAMTRHSRACSEAIQHFVIKRKTGLLRFAPRNDEESTSCRVSDRTKSRKL